LDLRVERFDEVVTHREVVSGEVGIVGGTVSLPMDLLLGPWTLGLVPGYVSTTATRQVDFSTSPTGRLSTPRKGVFNAGAAVRYEFPGDLSLFGEFVPKPARLPGTYRSSFALGLTYRTQRHRFTLAGTNASGSTLNQILAGDHAGGPRDSGQWSLGFNLVRVF
jgi:hypothetical protein